MYGLPYCLLIVLPQILTSPDDATVFIGQSAQLTCRALGTDIVYQWMKDSVVVSGANSNRLRITNIEESDEGVYKCVASNEGGQVESNTATITVYGMLVTTCMLYTITHTTRSTSGTGTTTTSSCSVG